MLHRALSATENAFERPLRLELLHTDELFALTLSARNNRHGTVLSRGRVRVNTRVHDLRIEAMRYMRALKQCAIVLRS